MFLCMFAWLVFKIPGYDALMWIFEKITFGLIYINFGIFILWCIKGLLLEAIEDYNENKQKKQE